MSSQENCLYTLCTFLHLRAFKKKPVYFRVMKSIKFIILARSVTLLIRTWQDWRKLSIVCLTFFRKIPQVSFPHRTFPPLSFTGKSCGKVGVWRLEKNFQGSLEAPFAVDNVLYRGLVSSCFLLTFLKASLQFILGVNRRVIATIN